MVNGTKKAYPGVPVFHEEIALQAREDGFVSTIYGYIRLLPGINSTNKYDRQSAARQAANTPIQGTAADVMKRAQNEVYEETGRGTAYRYDQATGYTSDDLLTEARMERTYPLFHGGTDMEAQIHDEMIFEMADDPDVVEAAWKWVQACMERPPIEGFPVPIEAEASVGYRWGEKRPVQEWLDEKRAAQKGA
jgi:DNA polymerase-1